MFFKYKYIIIYVSKEGFFGNAQIKCEKIKSIDDIRKIEKNLTKKINHEISIINYKKIGSIW